MTKKFVHAEPVMSEIDQLRALREKTSQQNKETRKVERVMTPVWGRLARRLEVNSLSHEYDLSMTPKELTS